MLKRLFFVALVLALGVPSVRAEEKKTVDPFDRPPARPGHRHDQGPVSYTHLDVYKRQFPVPGGTEDLLAEQAVALGLQRPVVDGLGLLHLAVRPRPDGFRAGQADGCLLYTSRCV